MRSRWSNTKASRARKPPLHGARLLHDDADGLTLLLPWGRPQAGTLQPRPFFLPLFTQVRGIGILGSSELPWYSDDLCATAHIHPPHTGVCWLRYVAC